MNKAVIYARYSSDNQTEQSIDGQLRVCREYAEKNGFVIVNEYIDRAMTGMNDRRPAFQQMLFDSKRQEFNFVLVYKFDRFARSRHDSAINKSILKKNGVKVVSATEMITDSPEGIILEGMLESFAEYYSAELSQKVKRGLKESRIKGLFTGGHTPYGYDIVNHKAQINEEQANIVREMFNDYLSGMRLKDIAEKFQVNGIKNNYGKDFTINSISRILTNPNYKGEVVADDTVYTNIFPAIVSQELFDEVNARLKVSKRTSAHFKSDANYLLSGKLHCGKCGGLMTGDSGKAKWETFITITNVLQRKKNKDTCSKKSIKKEYIEDIVLNATQEFLTRTDLNEIAKRITLTYNKSIEEDNVLKSLEKELQENNKKLKNLLTALENGIFNSTTNQRMQELEISKKEIEEKLANRQLLTIPPLEEKQVLSFLHSFKDLDYSLENAKQRLIDMFVNRIILFDDHCDIYFNVSNDKGTQLKVLPEEEQNSENIVENFNKKEQSKHKSSDYSHLAEHS